MWAICIYSDYCEDNGKKKQKKILSRVLFEECLREPKTPLQPFRDVIEVQIRACVYEEFGGMGGDCGEADDGRV